MGIRKSPAMTFDFPPKVGTGLEALPPFTTPECLDLLKKLLAYNPDDRYNTLQFFTEHHFEIIENS